MHDAVARACSVLGETETPYRLWHECKGDVHAYGLAVATHVFGGDQRDGADCARCGARGTVTSKLLQARSADEGMTCFTYCSACHAKTRV